MRGSLCPGCGQQLFQVAIALGIVDGAVVAGNHRGHAWVFTAHVESQPDVLLMHAVVAT